MGRVICVATDTSAASHQAAKWAADHLFQEGDTIHLVHCFSALKPAVGLGAKEGGGEKPGGKGEERWW